MTDVVITTSNAPTDEIQRRCLSASGFLGAPFVPRDGRSLAQLCADENARGALVVRQDRDTYVEPAAGVEYFFHPNLAKMRIGNLRGGRPDHLIGALGLRPGDEVLDCTLGFASEAIVCAHVVGPTGRVVGLEASPVIAWLAIQGLRDAWFVSNEFTATMRRVEAIHTDHADYLEKSPEGSFDVVYFDPIFDEPLLSSQSMGPLRALAEKRPLEADVVGRAVRVARRAVVIKQRRGSALWERVPVSQVLRGQNSKVEYGVLEAGACEIV